MSAWWARFVERHAPLMEGQYSAWDNLDGLTVLPDGDRAALEGDDVCVSTHPGGPWGAFESARTLVDEPGTDEVVTHFAWSDGKDCEIVDPPYEPPVVDVPGGLASSEDCRCRQDQHTAGQRHAAEG